MLLRLLLEREARLLLLHRAIVKLESEGGIEPTIDAVLQTAPYASIGNSPMLKWQEIGESNTSHWFWRPR